MSATDLTPSIRLIDGQATANAKDLEQARTHLKAAQNEVDRWQTTIGILEEIEDGYFAAISALQALIPTGEEVAA